ncbi:stage III sporulation protein SpoIIIAB [Natroniella sulfidigena]|uniref:stage III sporulation protein SpoIIIAB n=1 Tax=Natroniella sulfidigena TaxID=723921 RepID=UPI00200B3A5F|nr:stage III sporulation protein SpoIIIAB [Natroniella sulfidigena]MCK8817499.1 stage III sporulation protein SpoIIIAB [Natroniella sulfidigena]
MRLIGASLIIMSSGAIGFVIAKQFILRVKELQELQTALQMLETEISYGLTPLPQAFAKIATNLSTSVAELFSVAQKELESGSTAQQAWQEAIDQVFIETALGERDKEVLINLGYNLGQSASQDQQKHLGLAQHKLTNLYQQAVEEKEQKVKLWRYLGVLVGLFVVILIF